MPKLEFSDMNPAADYRKITLPSLRAVLRVIEARRRLDEVLRPTQTPGQGNERS